MKISDINYMTSGYSSVPAARKTGNAAFDEALSAAGREKKEKPEPLRPEDCYVKSEEEKLKEKNPKCMEDISTCARCEHRKECKSFKDKDNKNDNKEPNPFALEYFPKKFTNFYQRYLIMEKADTPKKDDRHEQDKKEAYKYKAAVSKPASDGIIPEQKHMEATHTVADNLTFYYNNRKPGEGKND